MILEFINKEKFRPVVEAAESGDQESRMIVRETLKPLPTDSADQIFEKITYFIRIFYHGSRKYEDAHFHLEIDYTYAEQVESYLKNGRPKYTGIMLVGYRESAKTTRAKMGQTYLNLYLKDLLDYINVVSEDGSSSDQFNMDMFNTFAFSKIAFYYPEVISSETRNKKKESQTMSKFTTATGVTYSATSARKSKRGAVQRDIDTSGEIEDKRPKQTIFDDIENETTVRSLTTTLAIKSVMDATIDGMDQMSGFWLLLGNYLSLRGNVARMIRKHKDDPKVKIIMIPIFDGLGNPTWPGKYVRTDEEEVQLAAQGIARRSIESIEKNSDNFETEYLNDPRRSRVYFPDEVMLKFDEDKLVEDTSRDDDGLLIIEEPESSSVYVISEDSGKGVGADETAFTIWKTTGLRYTEVGNFKSNKITPENAAPYVANIATRYNHALIIPENNFPGNEFIAFLRPIYNNIYKIEKGTDEDDKVIYEYGINTNLKTKPEMFLHTKRLLKDELVNIRSRALYDQISEYPADDVHVVKYKDGSGGHFDLLMSAVIGLWKAGTIADKSQKSDSTDARIKTVVNDVFQEVQDHR